MSARAPLRFFSLSRDATIKSKISSTIKEIEFHRKELESLRGRLEQRRKGLFDTTVKAMMTNDNEKANVYANEWAELRKVGKVVYASELALTQVVLRLESICDVGDVMSHMSQAFKVLHKVNRTVQGLVPSLDQASNDINSALAETMTGMGNISPTIQLNIQEGTGEEIVEQARKLAEERAEEMKRTLRVSPKLIQREAPEFQQRVPVLATGDAEDEEFKILGTLYKPHPSDEAEERVLQYATIHNGSVDVTDASTVLKMPSDDVEQAMLTLMARGKVKVGEGGGSEK
ncbi:MAG TPA: Snf7 family protein [Nitrososphaerales archaeon]|nr:Snf7 family protein [Nitrososphaerales archaeon]